MGADGILYIDQSMDLSGLDLSILQTMPIVLADEAVLTLTAAQADGLTIIAGPDDNDNDIFGTVNIVDLGDLPVDLSGIAADIAGFAILEDDDVTLDVGTLLGDFGIQLTANSTSNINLTGQMIRFSTEDQADGRVIDVLGADGDSGTNSSNVAWLFETITAPLDTTGYFTTTVEGTHTGLSHVGRLWFSEELINNEGGLVESLFNTLPTTVLRVDFADVAALNILINSMAVDRVFELASFATVNDLTIIAVLLVGHYTSTTIPQHTEFEANWHGHINA